MISAVRRMEGKGAGEQVMLVQNKWSRKDLVTDFIFLGSKITGDGGCNHEIKRRLLLGRKAMTNLDGVLKSRDVILPTKVCIVKSMVFLVWM